MAFSGNFCLFCGIPVVLLLNVFAASNTTTYFQKKMEKWNFLKKLFTNDEERSEFKERDLKSETNIILVAAKIVRF